MIVSSTGGTVRTGPSSPFWPSMIWRWVVMAMFQKQTSVIVPRAVV